MPRSGRRDAGPATITATIQHGLSGPLIRPGGTAEVTRGVRLQARGVPGHRPAGVR
ncbi:hypothetical protein [Streptomyces sp. CB03234]|uniref:hypothetical protein n=1 Tax=Streptomyces sp. (strain CB03234) TaxID=1703937 RepID=UPI0013013D45|nr:hypothetical protein [Streptomyces sp. CB03234]